MPSRAVLKGGLYKKKKSPSNPPTSPYCLQVPKVGGNQKGYITPPVPEFLEPAKNQKG